MFVKEIKYKDFNGSDRTEKMYFHLSLPEVTRIEAELGEETIKDHINRLVVDNNLKQLLSFLERIILGSYGVKSPDGRSFIKNDELRNGFEYSHAYAEFFEELLTKEGLAAEFGEKVADNGQGKGLAPKTESDETTAPTLVE